MIPARGPLPQPPAATAAAQRAAHLPHTPLAAGTEFDLVRAMLERWGSAARGVGDDAAELVVPPGETLVVSTDSSVEGVHFHATWLTPEEIGYRAAAAAVSDLAAMAATPLGMTVALTLPAEWRDRLDALADGVGRCARLCDVPVVGGDLVAGGVLSLTVTVLGSGAQLLRRSGALRGNHVWVTGQLGGPGLALDAWTRGLTPPPGPRERFAQPVPRLREARWLAQHGATSAIDCSDGLAADVAHLAAASRAHIDIDVDAVPCVPGATGADAARSGEEYELIVTAPHTIDAAAFEQTFGIPLTPVGRVTEAGLDDTQRHRAGVTLHAGGVPVPALRGFEHFGR